MTGWKMPETAEIYWAEREAKRILQPLWWRAVKRLWLAFWVPR